MMGQRRPLQKVPRSPAAAELKSVDVVSTTLPAEAICSARPSRGRSDEVAITIMTTKIEPMTIHFDSGFCISSTASASRGAESRPPRSARRRCTSSSEDQHDHEEGEEMGGGRGRPETADEQPLEQLSRRCGRVGREVHSPTYSRDMNHPITFRVQTNHADKEQDRLHRTHMRT